MALKVSDIGEKELIKFILTKSKDIIPDDTESQNIFLMKCLIFKWVLRQLL